MPKVMIEINLPDGWDIPREYDILKLSDPDWHGEWWHIEDVQEYYAGDGEYITFTDEEAREVLELMAKYNSPETGICWDSINVWQQQIYEERETEDA